MIRTKNPGKSVTVTRTKMAPYSQWNAGRPLQAYKLALLGLTDAQMAGVMGVNFNLINYWRRTKPEFAKALKEGKDKADANVAHAWYQSAIGAERIEPRVLLQRTKEYGPDGKILRETTKPLVFHVKVKDAPNPIACQKWLAIRQRALWTEVQKVDVSNTVNMQINVQNIDFSGVSTAELKALEYLCMKRLAPGPVNN